MAAVTPKIRSRKDGAAVPLDEFDKSLLNKMQGGFPIVPRPYAEVATALGVEEDVVLKRVAELVQQRIIRQVTPIYDTRALGYQSMLVAAKVDAGAPVAPGQDHQRAPRRLAQLPAQPRVQHVVHGRHRAGLARSAWRARWRSSSRRPARSPCASCRR